VVVWQEKAESLSEKQRQERKDGAKISRQGACRSWGSI